MTNKPMLSVERELLEKWASGWIKAEHHAEMRALLDKPEQPPVADLLLASAHSYVKVAGETQNLARHLQSRIEVYFDGDPDSKYQVEPVAVDLVHDRAYRDGLKRGFGLGENGQVEQYHKEFSAYQNGIVCAEKDAPAPVAVVMPERKGANHKDWREWTHEEIGYNKALDEVARLNGVKP